MLIGFGWQSMLGSFKSKLEQQLKLDSFEVMVAVEAKPLETVRSFMLIVNCSSPSFSKDELNIVIE